MLTDITTKNMQSCCRCENLSHSNHPGVKCAAVATEADNYCKPCHDKAADKPRVIRPIASVAGIAGYLTRIDDISCDMRRRHERALDRLREVAKSRGQELREYVPRQPDASPLPEAPGARPCTAQDASHATEPVGPPTNKQQRLGQRIVLITSFLIILGMTLFPPWIYVFDPPADLRHRFVRTERPAGYHLLFNDHSPQDLDQLLILFNLTPDETQADGYERSMMNLSVFSTQIDKNRIIVQVGAVLLLTAILYLAFRSGSPTQN